MSTEGQETKVPGMHKKIPVTIVTGYLGSGKTTLINYILQNATGRKIAVVENEFGEISIDGDLVTDRVESSEDIVSVSNGCVCCSLRLDLVRVLRDLYLKSQKSDNPYDSIVLETTGLADPAPIAFTFFNSPVLAHAYRLDSIICIVDSERISQRLEDVCQKNVVNEIIHQISYADIIFLNKIDLINKEELRDVEAQIKEVNGQAQIIHTQLITQGKRPSVDLVLNNNFFSLHKTLENNPQFLETDERTGRDHDTVLTELSRESEDATKDDDDKGTSEQTAEFGKRRLATDSQNPNPKRSRKLMHDLSNFSSIAVSVQEPLDAYRFNMFIQDLFQERSRDIHRSKGILCIKGKEQTKFVFQGVHNCIKYGPSAGGWRKDEPRNSRIVFIGRQLDQHDIAQAFKSTVWVPLHDGWEEYYDLSRQGQPYYVNSVTGQKSWERPQITTAQISKSQKYTIQPDELQPTEGGESSKKAGQQLNKAHIVQNDQQVPPVAPLADGLKVEQASTGQNGKAE